jgi:hypothetical protein
MCSEASLPPPAPEAPARLPYKPERNHSRRRLVAFVALTRSPVCTRFEVVQSNSNVYLCISLEKPVMSKRLARSRRAITRYRGIWTPVSSWWAPSQQRPRFEQRPCSDVLTEGVRLPRAQTPNQIHHRKCSDSSLPLLIRLWYDSKNLRRGKV